MSISTRAAIYGASLLAMSVTAPALAQQAPNPQGTAPVIEEAYFPEGQEPLRQLLILERALADKLNLGSMIFAASAEGIFERASAWDRGSTLSICFLDGSPEIQRKVATTAVEWNYAGAPVTLRFRPGGAAFQCGPQSGDIRITIVSSNSWAPYGRRNRSADMRLALVPPGGLSEAKFRQIVLHEFGHALGLWHELKHASGRCWSEFDMDELRAHYSREFGMTTDAQIFAAIGTFDPIVMARDFESTDFDRHSIMMYAFPKELYRDGTRSPCWAALRDSISDGDKATLDKAYVAPRVAASTIASLTANLDPEGQQIANAFNALLLADGEAQTELLETAAALPATSSAVDIASAILERSERISVQAFGQR